MLPKEEQSYRAVILCRSCDLAMRKRAIPSNVRAVCPRCDTPLYTTPYCSINGMLALCIASLVLFIPANLLPVLEIHFLGSVRTTTVAQAAFDVGGHGFWLVGVAVMASAVIAPALLVISIMMQVLIIRLNLLHILFWQNLYTRLLKIHGMISQMTMLEIYVISLLVSAFQLSDFADVYFGMGSLCFTFLFLTILFLQREYSLTHMWAYLEKESLQ